MNILVINCGSSSVKFQFFENIKTCLMKGIIERIGQSGSVLKYQGQNSKTHTCKLHVDNYEQAIKYIAETITCPQTGVIKQKNEIAAIGHRVVHGAEEFQESVLISERVLTKIRQCFKLAPLHNPPAYFGIKAACKIFPGIKQVAVFDTAFHQTMPDFTYLYALPYKYYQKYRIRRYGFHGTSHCYVAQRASQILKKPLNKLKLITAHLGNGCSITAIDKGKVLDTSMGFTPLEGLVMGTRCGDIDASIVLYLMGRDNLSLEDCGDILNKKSGLLGISGRSPDMRDIIKYARKNDHRANLAWKIFVYRIKKYIGAYIAAMNGVDAIVFTAGIGENSPALLKIVSKELSFLLKNAKVLVIPTNEELLIAQETYKLVGNRL